MLDCIAWELENKVADLLFRLMPFNWSGSLSLLPSPSSGNSFQPASTTSCLSSLFCVWPSLSTRPVNLSKLLFQMFLQCTGVQKPLIHFSTQAIFCNQSTQFSSGFPMTLSGSHKVFDEIVRCNSFLG